MRYDRKIVFLAGFLFSIPLALTSYINSSFLEGYVGEYYVGFVYVFASLITIIGLLQLPRILNRFGNRKTALFFISASFFSLLALVFGNNSFWAILGVGIYFISTSFLIASMDIFVEDISKNSNVGKFRGLYLMTINLAWIVAQIISGSIIAKSSFKGIYLFSAGFMILNSIIFIRFLSGFKDPKYVKVPILKTIKVFFKNKNLSKIYLISLLLKLFFAWMVIYTPIYLYEHMNFNWQNIGFIFTIMLIPFILVDYPLGRLSDKIGEKRVLVFGFLTAFFFTILIPFIKQPEIWIWALVLFGTRLGAASVEVMSESYFFKEIRERNADEVGFFRNTYPLSFILAPIIATPAIFFLPDFKYLFFLVSAFLLIGVLISLRLRDIKRRINY